MNSFLGNKKIFIYKFSLEFALAIMLKFFERFQKRGEKVAVVLYILKCRGQPFFYIQNNLWGLAK